MVNIFLQVIHKTYFRAALLNTHRLLRPGGFYFMIFPVSHVFMKACEEMAKIERFKPFVALENFIPHHYYSKDPVAELRKRLQNVGFLIQYLELRKMDFTFPSFKHMKSELN